MLSAVPRSLPRHTMGRPLLALSAVAKSPPDGQVHAILRLVRTAKHTLTTLLAVDRLPRATPRGLTPGEGSDFRAQNLCPPTPHSL